MSPTRMSRVPRSAWFGIFCTVPDTVNAALLPAGLPFGDLLPYAALLLGIVSLCAYWIYRLHKEVSARLKIERELRESQAKLLAILEAEPACVKITDADGHLLYMNRAGLCMIGADNDPALVLGKDTAEIVIAEDRLAFTEMNRQVLRNNQEATLEYRIQSLQGTRRHMETHAIPFRDWASGVPAVLAVTRDISSRKRAEAKAERVGNMLGAIRTAQAAFIADPNGGNAFASLLRALLDQTGSRFGFIAEVLEDAQHSRYLMMHSINLEVAEPLISYADISDWECHCPGCLLERVLSDGKAVIVNHGVSASQCESLPEAFPNLQTFLGLPFRYADQVLGMIGLANRHDGYGHEHCQELEPLLTTCGNLIAGLRNHRARLEAEESLRQSHARYDELAARIPTGVYTFEIHANGHMAFDYVSPRFCELLGLSAEAVLNDAQCAFAQVHPDELSRFVALNRRAAETLQPFDWEGRFVVNGQTRHLHIQSTGRRLPDGGSVWSGVIDDITARKQQQEQLQLAARVFAEAHEGILITDPQGVIVDVNPTFCAITGYSREETLGRDANLLDSGIQSPEFFAAMWEKLLDKGHWQGELWNRTKGGELFAERLSISTLRNDDGQVTHYLGLFSDITVSKRQQQALEQLAHFDPLTGLPNRVLFADRIVQAMHRCKRDQSLLGVGYLDLDGFKPVNDTFGHDTGDRLLVAIAERMQSNLREQDTVSRFGGDEFVVLLVGLESVLQLQQTLQRLLHSIGLPIILDGQTIQVGASIGVTVFPLDSGDPDTLLRHADQAMYQAKLLGRNRYQLFVDGSTPTQAQPKPA